MCMGLLERKTIHDRETWLKERTSGIGASEAAAIVGFSPYMTANQLWEMKALGKEPADISDNEAVARGVRYEPVLRELYKAHHPELSISHYPFDMLYQQDRPWLFATLDGEIETPDGHKGILEIKTASPNGRASWNKWNLQVPDVYYCQACHQLLATGYEFVNIFACLIGQTGDMEIREYRFEREDCKPDMTWLLDKEIEFWESVKNKAVPKLSIRI